MQEAGKLYPSREGVHLSEYEWGLLASATDSLCQALAHRDYAYTLPLGVPPARTVTVCEGSSGAVVCIPPGASIPGNPEAPLKGIRLTGAAFRVRALCRLPPPTGLLARARAAP